MMTEKPADWLDILVTEGAAALRAARAAAENASTGTNGAQDDGTEGTDEADKNASTDTNGNGNGARTRRFFWDDELDALPERQWLIPEWLPLDADTEAFGKWGSAKTFLILHMAGCLATGRDFHGLPVVQSYVVFVAAEGFRGIPLRWQGWKKRYDVPGRAGVLFHQGAVDLLRDDDVTAFLVDVRGQLPVEIDRPVTFVFDTKSRCTPGLDESDVRDSATMLANLARIRAEFAGQCTTVLLHHPGRTEQDRARGHSSEDGALDTTMRIEKPQKGVPARVKLSLGKQKDGRDDRELYFQLTAISLGGDALTDDSPMTAVIEEIEAPAQEENTKSGDPLAKRARTALLALVRSPGQTAAYTTWETASGQPKTTFERAVRDLTGKAYVVQRDGLYEPTEAGLDYCELYG